MVAPAALPKRDACPMKPESRLRSWDTIYQGPPAKSCVSHEEISRDFFMGHADFAVGPVVAGKRGFSLGLYPIEW